MKQVYRPFPKLTAEDRYRFWSKVDRRGPDDCWPWLASCCKSGRGMFRISGKLFKAPRVVYFLTKHRDPGERDVCHTCDNPGCCNPKHLWRGTRTANNSDRDAKGRQVSRRGEKHGCAILTEKQVRMVLKSNLSGRYLAWKLNVHECTVSAIRHRRIWKWLNVR